MSTFLLFHKHFHVHVFCFVPLLLYHQRPVARSPLHIHIYMWSPRRLETHLSQALGTFFIYYFCRLLIVMFFLSVYLFTMTLRQLRRGLGSEKSEQELKNGMFQALWGIFYFLFYLFITASTLHSQNEDNNITNNTCRCSFQHTYLLWQIQFTK